MTEEQQKQWDDLVRDYSRPEMGGIVDPLAIVAALPEDHPKRVEYEENIKSSSKMERFEMRLLEDEKRRWVEEASKRGMSMSGWVKAVLTKELLRDDKIFYQVYDYYVRMSEGFGHSVDIGLPINSRYFRITGAELVKIADVGEVPSIEFGEAVYQGPPEDYDSEWCLKVTCLIDRRFLEGKGKWNKPRWRLGVASLVPDYDMPQGIVAKDRKATLIEVTNPEYHDGRYWFWSHTGEY